MDATDSPDKTDWRRSNGSRKDLRPSTDRVSKSSSHWVRHNPSSSVSASPSRLLPFPRHRLKWSTTETSSPPPLHMKLSPPSQPCNLTCATSAVMMMIKKWWCVLDPLIVQELCESRGGRPGLSVLNEPSGFRGRKDLAARSWWWGTE